MARPPAGRKKNHVEPEACRGKAGMPGDVILRGADDPGRVDGQQRIALELGRAALLDLDEDRRAKAPGDQVDLAHRGLVAARNDPVAGEPEEPGGQRLAPPPGDFGILPFGAPRCSVPK